MMWDLNLAVLFALTIRIRIELLKVVGFNFHGVWECYSPKALGPNLRTNHENENSLQISTNFCPCIRMITSPLSS